MTRSEDSQTDFSREAIVCVRQTQAAFSALLSGAGLDGARPTEVGRSLGLDKTLAWKVSRFSETSDPLKAVKHIPGSGGVEIVLKAALEKGVGSTQVEAARDADRAFRAFIRQHAGDRRSFEAMLASGGRDERIELEERRSFYRSGSALWGIRAKVQFLTLLLGPSRSDEDRIDVLQLSGLLEFERLRSDVPWIIRRLWTSDSVEEGADAFRREALVPNDGSTTALPMIPEFCSDPIPEIRQFTGNDGVIYDEIAPGPVGKHGILTCVSGEMYHAALPRHWSEDNTYGRYELLLRTPVEMVVFDIYVHRDLEGFGDFDRTVYGLLEGRPGIGQGKSHTTPMIGREAATRLGDRLDAFAVRHERIPEFSRMVTSSLHRAGWDGIHAFRGYRSSMEFPATPSCLTMECPIHKP